MARFWNGSSWEETEKPQQLELDIPPRERESLAPVGRADPITSRLAAKDLLKSGRVNQQLLRVYKCIDANKKRGMIDEEVVDETGVIRVTTRRKTLEDAGLVWWSGKFRKTKRGKKALVWTTDPDQKGDPSVREKKAKTNKCEACGGTGRIEIEGPVQIETIN